MIVPFSCLVLFLSYQFVEAFRLNRLQAVYHTRLLNMAVSSKTTTAESTARFDVLTEIERQQQQNTARYGRFMEHRQRLKELGLTNAAASGLSKRKEKMGMFHFSSGFDDLKPSDNTNINDKFWRAALKLGTVVKGLEGFPVVPEKFGPFTEPETITTAVNSKTNSKSNTNIDQKQTVFFREFQWIFFQKLVYNRPTNREEIWSSLHEDIDFVVTDIRNANFEKDGNYDRIVVFKQV